MARYVTKPTRSFTTYESYWSDGQTEGREVHDNGDWSEDQPIGLLDADGDMIWREGRRIGFMADH